MTGRVRVVLCLSIPVLLLVVDVIPGAQWPLTALRVLLGVPALLVIPGSLLLDVVGRRRPGGTGLVDAVACSIGVMVALGLLLNLVGIPLQRTTWAGAIELVCVGLAAPLLYRRTGLEMSARPSLGYPAVIVVQALAVLVLAAWTTVVIAQRAERQNPVISLDVQRTGPATARLQVTTPASEAHNYVLVVRPVTGSAVRYPVTASATAPWHVFLPIEQGGFTAQLQEPQAAADAKPLRMVRLGARP